MDGLFVTSKDEYESRRQSSKLLWMLFVGEDGARKRVQARFPFFTAPGKGWKGDGVQKKEADQ